MHLTGLVLLFSSFLYSVTADFNETQLDLFYSGVQDWFKFSRRYDITRECSENEPLRVAYFTRHPRTTWDFIAVADHLNVPFTVVHPGLVLALSRERHRGAENEKGLAEAKWKAMGQAHCHMADVLVFGDYTADARGMLQGNCTTPIILQVATRFDHGVNDRQQYYALMLEAARRPNVWWISTNPYDKMYLESRGVKVPADRIWTLRPVGVNLLPPPKAELAPGRAPYVAFVHHVSRHHLESSYILPWIHEQNLTEHVYEHGSTYGGAAVLAQHRGVLQVPYQVSVMKMYEGLAAGVAFIIPSPAFFSKLLKQFTPKHMDFCCRSLVFDNPTDWQQYVEWYHPDFLEAMTTYDSWDELKAIIKGEGQYTPAFFEDKKRKARAAMERARSHTLAGYDQVYAAARKYACSVNGLPDAWSAGMGTHVVGGVA